MEISNRINTPTLPTLKFVNQTRQDYNVDGVCGFQVATGQLVFILSFFGVSFKNSDNKNDINLYLDALARTTRFTFDDKWIFLRYQCKRKREKYMKHGIGCM